MKFDVEADVSGFTSAMQSVQDSVMTTYEKIERQNRELDESLAQAMSDITDMIANTGEELKELEADNKQLEESLDNVARAMDEAYDSGDMTAFEEFKAQLAAGNKVLEEQYAQIDVTTKKLNEYKEKQVKIAETTKKVSDARERDKDTLVDLLGGQEKYNTIISALPPALQSSQGGIMNMVKAAKAFIATPFGLAIAAIAAALKAVMSYFTSTVEGERQFAQISGYVSGILAKMNDVVVAVGKGLVKMFTDPKKALTDFKDMFVENIQNRFKALLTTVTIAGKMMKDLFEGNWDQLGDDAKKFGEQWLTIATGVEDCTGKIAGFANELHETGKAMGDLAAREKKLELDRSEWAVKRASLEAKRNQIMEKMYEGTYEQQLQSAKEAMELNNQIAAQDKKLAKEALDIVKTKNSLASSNTSDLTAENQAKAELARIDAETAAANKRLARQTETIGKSIRESNLALNEQQQESLKQLTRANIDNQFEAAQAEINAMNEGAEKKRRQRELNHEKEVEQIKRQEEDSVKAARDAAKAAWKANAANSNKTFDDKILNASGDDYAKLSDSDKQVVDNYLKAVEEARKKAATALKGENIKFFDVNDLLGQYQDFDDKRKAIEDKYVDERKRLTDALVKYQEDGNIEMVNSINKALGRIDMEEAKEKMQNSLEALKADPAFVDAFQDLKKVSTETLNSLYDRLVQNKEALANLDPDQLKVLTDLMSNMEDEILNRAGSIEAYKQSIEDLKNAEIAKAANDERVTRLQKEYNDVVKAFGATSKEAKAKLEQLTRAQSMQIQASNDVTAAQTKQREAFTKLKGEMDELASAIRGIGDSIGEEGSEVIGFLGDIYDFTVGAIDGIQKMSTAGANALSTIEKASVILTIIQAAIKIFQKLHEITNKFSDSTAYDKAVEKQKSINKLTDSVNEYTLAMIKAENEEKNWFGESALGKLKSNSDEMAKVYSNYYDKLYQAQVRYRDKSKNDDNWTVTMAKFIDPTIGTINGLALAGGGSDYNAQYAKAIDNLRIETKARKKSFMGIGGHNQETADLRTWAKKQFGDDLFDADGWINGTLATQIIESYGDKLQGETKATLEQLVELKEQYDEYMSQLKDYVNQLYSPLVENFTDSIMDWLDSGKDALNSFQQYAGDVFRNIVKDMLNTIVLEKVVGSYQEDILDMYQKYSEGNMTEEDLLKKVAIRTNEMVDTYEQQIPILQQISTNMRDIIEDTTGIDLSSTNKTSATTGVSASFTQDSVDEANGRMAALQMGQQAQIEAIASMASNMSALVYTVGDSNVFLSDLRDMAGIRNSMLTDMYDRMGAIYQTLGGKLSEIVNNTKEL